MSLASVITTAAANLGISKREAAKLAAKHGRGGLVKTLNALADVLDGRRLSGSTLGALPTALAKTLSSAIDRRVHGQPKPPVIQPGAGGGSIFRTRPAPTVADRMNQPPRPGEEGGWSPLTLTPGSSNVYSFRYFREAGQKLGVLEVSFKSHNYHAGSLTAGSKKHKGKDTLSGQLTGVLGGTIAGGSRPNSMGVTYHYRNVAPATYASMKQAVSKGKWVWRELRILGQLHGGKYPYSVASGDLNLGAGGAYLPRRATAAKGGGTAFRTRSLAEVGSGARGFIVSTLSSGVQGTANGGFRTRPAPGKRGR